MKTKISKFLLILAIIPLFVSHIGAQINPPKVSKSIFFGISDPIREAKIVLSGAHEKEQQVVLNFVPHDDQLQELNVQPADKPVLQRSFGTRKSIGPHLNIEGIGNVNDVFPADPNGEVGLDHYIQTVNCSFAVWDKEGNLLYGPVDYQTLWESFPGPWHNDLLWSDPIIKYDHLADRWIISCMSVEHGEPPYYEMIAVSTSGDPLGSYYCYAFEYEYINDYQKLSIWHDGYYLTYNMFDYPGEWVYVHTLVSVIDRDAMLIGEPEVIRIQFEIPDPDIERFFPLAADLRGVTFQQDAPGYIVTVDNHNPDNPWELSLDLYKFQTDWLEPENSIFEQVSQFELGAFEPVIDFGPGAPQLGSENNVMTIPVFLMYPLSYRSFDTHESMVCCHTMWNGDVHYIKWYELRKEDSEWYMYQSGNYAPGELHYFMPSISINGKGDITLGYNVSSGDMYPSIRLTGRQAEDDPGLMTFEEIEVFKGMNYANTFHGLFGQNRWGDYASMMVDPTDDSTFWFTSMYTTQSTDLGNWATRITAFDLSGVAQDSYADAGNDTLTCNTLFFTTQGKAENYSSIMWTSSGDGTFIDNYSQNVTYLRGPGDISNQQVILTIHLTGYDPGSLVADSMILYINKEPEVYAGPDVTIGSEDVVELHGEVNYAYDYYWTTLGDGVFTDSTMLNAIYTPGMEDISNEAMVLVLTAKEVNPCSGTVSDSLLVSIPLSGVEDVMSKRIEINLFPNPTDGNITLQAVGLSNATFIMQIIGSDGRIIFTGRYISDNKHFEIQIDMSYLDPGIYFVRFQDSNQSSSSKVVLQ